MELLHPKHPLIAGIIVDPNLDTYQDGMPKEAHALCDEITAKSESENPESAIEPLQKFVKEFGNTPWTLCFAFESYMFIGEDKLAEDLLKEAYKQFPDDLLVRTQMGMLYIQSDADMIEKVPTLFNQQDALNALYPAGTTVSIKAVHNWAFVLGGYCVFNDDIEGAQEYLAVLQEISPEHPATEQLAELITDAHELEELLVDFEGEDFELDEEDGDEDENEDEEHDDACC